MPFSSVNMIIYLDTETTGLRPGNICQLSYLMQYENTVVGKNYFFKVNYVEPSAEMVHHFSVELLNKLSNGQKFSDRIEEIENDFLSANLIVTHNVSFDFSFLRKEFEKLGKIFKYKNEFCSMKRLTHITKLKRANSLGYKYPKLCELTAFLGITDKEVQENTQKFFSENLLYHDARYDATAVYLAVNRVMNSFEEFKFLRDEL